ncbi:hypothetical protein AAMO2058_000404000 [Amorphochlora amoebiformis]
MQDTGGSSAFDQDKTRASAPRSSEADILQNNAPSSSSFFRHGPGEVSSATSMVGTRTNATSNESAGLTGDSKRTQSRNNLAKHDDVDESDLQWQLLCILLVLGNYGLFMVLILIPQLHSGHAKSLGYKRTWAMPEVTAFVFHFLFLLFWWSYIRAACSDPGRVPPKDTPGGWLWQKGSKKQLEPKPDIERKIREVYQDEKWPGPQTEQEFEIWRSVKVLERKRKGGHHNYKFFLLAVFYGTLLAIFIHISSIVGFVHGMEAATPSPFHIGLVVVPILFLALSSLSLSCLVGSFGAFHLHLTMRNMSTIEYREKHTHSDASIRHRFRVVHYKFDRGSFHNFCHIFGYNPLIWFLPIRPDSDGLYLTG